MNVGIASDHGFELKDELVAKLKAPPAIRSLTLAHTASAQATTSGLRCPLSNAVAAGALECMLLKPKHAGPRPGVFPPAPRCRRWQSPPSAASADMCRCQYRGSYSSRVVRRNGSPRWEGELVGAGSSAHRREWMTTDLC